MHVRILQDTDYTPRPGDSARCFGQLRSRASRRRVEFVAADGGRMVREEVGPMVFYFRAGATPELADDVAQEWISAGIAEPYTDMQVTVVSTRDIMDGILVQ